MRLRAVMSDVVRIKSFLEVCEILKKITATGFVHAAAANDAEAHNNNSRISNENNTNIILRMTSDKWYFHRRESATNGGIKVVAEINVSDFFNSYEFEGFNRQDANEIYLYVSPASLVSALSRHIETVRQVKLKLVRKPSLRVEVELPPVAIGAMPGWAITECNIQLIARDAWNENNFTPNEVVFDVSLASPSLSVLHNVVEKMGSLHQYPVLTLQALNADDGTLRVSAGMPTDSVEITSSFRNLQVMHANRNPPRPIESRAAGNHRWFPPVPNGSDIALFPRDHASVRVDLKRFLHFLGCLLASQTSSMKCQFAHNNMVMLSSRVKNIYLRYIIPAHCEPSD